MDEYIKNLEIVVDIHRMNDGEKERVVQLINKTNQFNTTTKRYTAAEIDRIAADEANSIYVVYSSDKYGDNGLVSVIILMDHADCALIDTFLMSCRVMGRNLENVIMNEVAAKYKKRIVGEYIATAKNRPVTDLYDRLGFTIVTDNKEHKVYELNAADYTKKEIDCYKEIRFEK